MKEYDDILVVEEVTIGGKSFEIRGLTTDGRKKYIRAVKDTMEVRLIGTGTKDDEGQEFLRKEIKVLDFDSASIELLHETMFRINEDGTKTALTKQQIGQWGAKLTEQLANHAARLNGLNQTQEDADKDAEKN